MEAGRLRDGEEKIKTFLRRKGFTEDATRLPLVGEVDSGSRIEISS
jgi:hypothetical protein